MLLVDMNEYEGNNFVIISLSSYSMTDVFMGQHCVSLSNVTTKITVCSDLIWQYYKGSGYNCTNEVIDFLLIMLRRLASKEVTDSVIKHFQ